MIRFITRYDGKNEVFDVVPYWGISKTEKMTLTEKDNYISNSLLFVEWL